MFQGGSVIRLFHKELEAFVVAEGLFDDEVTENGKKLACLIKLTGVESWLFFHLHINDYKDSRIGKIEIIVYNCIS